MKTIQDWVQMNGKDISELVTDETLLIHSSYSNNTVEARATCHIQTPDGEVYEGERVIKFRMRRLRNNPPRL
jgi:hypothetical protein